MTADVRVFPNTLHKKVKVRNRIKVKAQGQQSVQTAGQLV